jgi:methylated-DNA-protein-cysteine methyltransferase-like protein
VSDGWNPYYRVVKKIPRGRVTTYGVIARLAGAPRTARHVGWALAALHGKPKDVPWHRVLGSRGAGYAGISLPDEAGGTQQRKKLIAEGVRFDVRGRVPLEKFGWR